MLKQNGYVFDCLICLGLMVLAGVVHVFYPSEIRWDLANYHYYNAWAFIHGRLGYDIAPAMINTYFNPLLDVPHYFMLNAWGDGSIVKFFQGSYYGILVFVFYKIVRLFFDFKKEPFALIITFIIGATGFSALCQLGTGSNEIQSSILILWGFYLICSHISDTERRDSIWIWPGLIMGAALGLKPTVITYCAAMGVSLILFMKPLNVSLKEIVIFAFSGLAGFLIVNGWWMWQLYSHFDNPFFPFLNKIFKSEYYDLINFRDTQYIDKTTWWQKLFLPLNLTFLSVKDGYMSEAGFFDWRYAAVYVIAIFMFVRWVYKSRKLSERHNLLLYVFLFVSYLIWVNLFSNIRYIIPTEMLSAIVLVKFFQHIKFQSIFGNTLLLSFKIIGFYALISEVPAYLSSWLYDLPIWDMEKVNLPEDALVKTYGFPSAMVAARLIGDQSNRIVAYANGNIGVNIDFLEHQKLKKVREDVVKNHRGPVVALVTYNFQGKKGIFIYTALVRRAKLEKEGMYCRVLRNYIDIIDICVPKDLKDDIFTEAEKHRTFDYPKPSDEELRHVSRSYVDELNQILDNTKNPILDNSKNLD